MKGVLAVAHAVEKFVYHSVHMLFSGDFVEPWAPGEERSCKMVFIGKNLDEEDIKRRFQKCLASGEKDAARRQALRFAVGDRVECAVNNCWAPGTVIAHMYRDDGMPPGPMAPRCTSLPTPCTSSGSSRIKRCQGSLALSRR